MSTLKKGLAILLAVVMAMALAVPALAGDSEPSGGSQSESTTEDGKGKITITNTVSGETYKVYRVLDATWDGDKAFHYVVNDNFKEFFVGTGGTGGIDSVKTAISEGTNVNDAIYNYIRALTGDAPKKEFAVKLAKYVSDKHVTESESQKATGTETVINNLDYGYYLMVPTTGTTVEGETNIQGSVMFSLGTVDNELTIANKTTYPTPTKKVSGPNDNGNFADYTFAGVGDTLKFRVTGTVEKIDGYKTYDFKIVDTMSGMTYKQDSLIFYMNDEPVAKQQNGKLFKYIMNPTTNQWELSDEELKTATCTYANNVLTFHIPNLKPLVPADGQVVGRMEYEATVSDSAQIGGKGNPNSVYFEYSRDPNSDVKSSSTVDETRTYILQLKLNKVKEDGTTPLRGSSWKLSKFVAGGAWQTVDEIPGTDKSEFSFKGMGVGLYKLEETDSPAGYSPIGPIQFEIKRDQTIGTDAGEASAITKINLDAHAHSHVVGAPTTDLSTGVIEYTVKNTTQGILPATGGAGLYIVAGVAIVALLGFGGTAMLKRKVNGEN